jgi:subtilase family serine protease
VRASLRRLCEDGVYETEESVRSLSRPLSLVVACVGLAVMIVGMGGTAEASPSGSAIQSGLPGCARAPVRPGRATCNERILADDARRPTVNSGESGYGPADLQAAYGLTAASASEGAGQTIAVIEAYNDPSAEADLAVYRSQFGLPPCGTGCFTVVNQAGAAGPYPKNNQGWASEESLDVDMVSAICPNCKILVVEANSEADANLGEAVDTAASLGANAISNSFASPESKSDLKFNKSYFDHPGVAVTAGSGDNGYEVEYPAASPYVTAVGGTTLKRSSSARGWTETAWKGSGAGCSVEEPKPTWQKDSGCSQRTVADVSFDANLSTGVAAYDSDCSLENEFEGICFQGWGIAGGTSVGAPAIAAIYGLAGNSSVVHGANIAYADPRALNNITSGSDGTCSPKYLCTAGPGYNGPTGLGTPEGTGAF